MAIYNPFKKPIGQQLDVNDLNELITNSVAEGFYVEYKSDFPDPKKIARSIASFANTYGGWYFIGIEADKSKGGVAVKICGFDIAIHQDPINKALTPVRQNLSHMPLLEHQTIDIGFNKSVIAIYVSEGIDTPYIADNGVIYRRAADASDPILEKDRHSIDQLVNKGKNERERFNDFCCDERTFRNDESELTWINIYLQSQPRKTFMSGRMIEAKLIEELLNKSKEIVKIDLEGDSFISGNIPFDTGYVTGDSVILTQTQPNRRIANSLQIQLFMDGGCKIHIPIPRIEDLSSLLVSEVAEYLRSLHRNESETYLSINLLNLGQVSFVSGFLIIYYLDWLKKNEISENIKIWSRITINNTWHIVPVIDSKHWVDYVQVFGLPILQFEERSFPEIREIPIEFPTNTFDGLWGVFQIFAAQCMGISHDRFWNMLTDDLIRRTFKQIN